MGNIITAGKYRLDLDEKTHVMGIVNVTPDSFSDGGKYNHPETAARHAAQLVQDGAHIIDLGGESPRPGHDPVSAEEACIAGAAANQTSCRCADFHRHL